MRRTQNRPALATAALACVVAMVIAACGGGGGSRRAAPSPAPSASLPNPFTITARFSPSSLGLDHPVDLAVGPDGNVYVTDSNHSVAVVSPDGKLLRRWGKAGKGPGEFRFLDVDSPAEDQDLHGYITVGSDGRVYVADSWNYRIQVFSATGRFVRQFDFKGEHPATLAVDAAGTIYAAADPEGGVSKLSSDGTIVWRLEGAAVTDPDVSGNACCYVRSIDAHGRIVLGNDDTRKIVYIDARGRKLDAFDVTDICDVTLDALGDTFVMNGCGDVPIREAPADLLVFDRGHKLIGRWNRADNVLLNSPVFGPNGEVFGLGPDGTIFRLRVTLPA